MIVTGSEDNTARIWDAKSGQCHAVLGHAKWVNYAGFSPDNKKVVTACADQKPGSGM